GVRVRAQCETFIAVAVTAAMVLAASRTRRPAALLLSGACVGVAFWLQDNAGIYLAQVLAMAAISHDDTRSVRRLVMWAALGFVSVAAIFLSYFAVHGALTDLRLATIDYNLQYSGETYEGVGGVLG